MVIEKRRVYKNYEEYTAHQLSKTASQSLRKRLNRKFKGKVEKFKKRFIHFKEENVLLEGNKVLCMGARMGEEVVALNDLGLDAIGIDLEPNPPFVIKADFNNLPFDSESYDVVYTNSFDHAWDASMFFGNVYNILKKDGYFIIDVFPGEENYARCEVLMIGKADDVIKIACQDDKFEFIGKTTKKIPSLQRRHKEVQLLFKRK